MRKITAILCLVGIVALNACRRETTVDRPSDVIASVDSEQLTLSRMLADMPSGFSSGDSLTFARLYVDNWIMRRLKMHEASELLCSSQEDIDRLVEGYRQSLIMRKLDQYYIDNEIDPDVTAEQIAAYYRSHGDTFKLDQHLVRGLVVKAPAGYRNMSRLVEAVRATRGNPDRVAELAALCEKNSLQLTDMTHEWVGFSDFLSNLPTDRSRSYEALLSKREPQQMTASGQVFCFIIEDAALAGSTAPLQRVESDIRRILYAQRRSEIVSRHEQELRERAAREGRVMIYDPTTGEARPSQAASVENEEN